MSRSFENQNKNKKIKLIHISTDEVYGDIKEVVDQMKSIYAPSSPILHLVTDHLIKSYVRTYKNYDNI